LFDLLEVVKTRLIRSQKGEKGFALLEVLVAIAIIGVVAAGFLLAMKNAVQGAEITDRIDTARVIAQAQMEYIKTQPFRADADYAIDSALMSQYPGYSVPDPTVENAQDRDGLIQKITVSVIHDGKTVMTLQDCKTK
jgi:prepilin-type N-terminal cleavage/methylation domain-containing protein